MKVGVGEAAQHIFLGQRRFYELLNDGAIERQASGYLLDDVRKQYIFHMRKMAAGRGAESGLDLASERARLAREQTQAAALKNAATRGEYISIEEVGRQLEEEYGVIRQRLLTIPSIAESLVGLDRAAIEAALRSAVTDALNELHDAADIIDEAKTE